MKRFLPILFLLFAFISNAQNTLDNIGLTSATPASVAYSLRQLSTTYTGPLVRVKVGTSFYDVYPDLSTNKFSLSSKISASISTYNSAASAASTNALSTIISGSTDATVAIWYDQSGNGVHVLSSSPNAKIITGGSINTMNGQPTINFTGTNSYLTSATTVNYSSQTNATVNAVVQDVASTNYISGILSTGDNGGWGLCYDPTTTIKGYWVDASGGNGAFSNENSTAPKIVTGTIGTPASGTSSAIYVNSSLKGTKVAQNLANGTADNIYVGSRGNFGGRQFVGNISETMMFPKTLSASEQAALESSQSIFLPVPPSVTITSNASGTVCAGTSITFTAIATGLTNPSYQWTKNGIGIPGTNSSTYTTTTLSNNDQINVWVNAGINPSSIVSNGLLLNLDASNPGSYSGTGNTWYDLSGNNKHGTLMNSPTYDAASGSIVTNGTNQYISIPQVSTANTNITMQAWVYVNLNTTGTFIKNGTGGGGYSIGIGNWAYDQVGSNVVMLLYGRGWIGSGVSYGTAGWKLVTLTLDGSSTAKAYVNGTLIGTYTWPTPTSPSGPLNLGANIGDGNIYYNGKFAAAYFYNRALSLTEIQQNYNAFATKTTPYGSNTITVSISGSTPTVSVSGDGCANKTTLTTTSGSTSYAWYKDNSAVSGATSNVYTPTAAGVYKVQVTSGSCSSTSTTTTIYSCGRSADGRMIVVDGSTTLVSTEGSVNNGKGVDDSGKILSKPWVYGTVTTRTGRIWLDRNLGASRVATSSTDTQAYGDYYQWGRPADGHEKQIVSGTASNYTTTRSASSVPGNSNYIFPSDGSWDWLITPDNTLWTGVNAPNNPCPSGYRIPTESEWSAEAAVFTSPNVAGSYEAGYGLKLTVAGMAGSANNITAIGNYGQYMTQTAYDNGRVKYFGVISYATWFDTNYYKITGQSVRCIKD